MVNLVFNEKKLKGFAENVSKQTDRYGLPTAPKKKAKEKKKKSE